ncbi:MAG: hypothetical protein HY370_08405 [Proteobacteria bacterium]|nr:hypothetical protein [Pseudomonadota bacterium]
MDDDPKRFLRNFFGFHGTDFGKQNNWELEALKKLGEKRHKLMGESALATPANSFKAMWEIARPYWQSEEKWKAWGKTGAIVGMTLGMVGLDLAIANTLGDFWGSVQRYDADMALNKIEWFSVYAFSWVFLRGVNQKTSKTLQMDWRNWLTKQFTDAVFDKKALSRVKSDNIDQRIAEDLNLLPEKTIALVTGATLKGGYGILEAATTFLGFIGMLATVSGTMPVTIGGATYNMPYMVPVVIAYAAIGTVGARLIGKPLNALNFQKQKREGDYRHGWAHVRENSNEIGLWDGEDAEKKILDEKFGPVKKNWTPLVNKEKHVTWYSAAYEQIAAIFPVAVSLPAYFSHEIADIGGLQKIARAFNSVQNSLSFVINSYGEFAACAATYERVCGLRKNIAEAHDSFDKKNEPPVSPHTGGAPAP